MPDEIQQAMDRGDWHLAEKLVDELPERVESGLGWLRSAVVAGQAGIVSALCLRHVDVLAPWPAGGDALTWAAANGDLDVLIELLPTVETPPRQALTAARHPAIVTLLEEALGIEPEPDDLLDRARHPGARVHATLVLTRRRPAEPAYRWAIQRLDDTDAGSRRFAADVLQGLSFDDQPFERDAAAVLRPRLGTESDPHVLGALLDAYGNFHGPGPMPDVRAHAGHPAPEIRARVADVLTLDPGALDTLTGLAADPDGDVRAAALHTLGERDAGRAVFESHRADEHTWSRAHALAWLARHGDAQAAADLDRLAAEEDGLYWLNYSVRRAISPLPR